MTLRVNAIGVLLILAFGLACTSLSVSPSSRFRITERFPKRMGQVEVFGVEVRSALPEGTIPDEQLEKLSAFFTHELQQTTIGLVANLNAGAEAEMMAVILTVDINRLDAATQEEQLNRVPSRLYGKIKLHRVATDKKLGAATILVAGAGLDLEANYAPDTVREFAAVLRRIVQ